MNVFELVLKWLRLKTLQGLDWTERKLAALALALKLVMLFFFAPFIAAMVMNGFDASDRAISTAFALCMIPTMAFMVVTLLRTGTLTAATYAIGSGLKKVGNKVFGDDGHEDGAGHAKGSLSGLVFKKLLRAFAWMLYVAAFYAVVPIWRDFVWYVVSLALTGFVTFYVLGYPEDNKPEYRKLLFRIALIAFMAVVMVSTGAVRYMAQSSEAAWEQLPSIMVFSTAVVFGLAGIAFLILAPLSKDGVKDALKVGSKVALIGSAAMFALVFLFGDMTWLQFRKSYSEVRAVPNTVEYVKEKVVERKLEQALRGEGDRPTAQTDIPPPGGMYNEPVPMAPPEPDKPSKRSSKSDQTAAAPVDPAPRAQAEEPIPVVRQTPHEGDELDAVTDRLDRMANRRAAVGL